MSKKWVNASEAKEILKYSLISDDSVLLNGLHGIGKTSIVKQFAEENNMYLETLILSLKDPSDLLGMPKIDKSSNRTVWEEPDWFQHIVDQAWPLECEYQDLRFNDVEFKQFIETQLDIKDNIKRQSLNEAYCKFYRLDNRVLQLTREQYNISCDKSRSSLLFLDELNRALPDTRNTALQLVLEKELHSHKLPFVNGKRTFICSAINPSDIYQTDELDLALLDRFLIINMRVCAEDWLYYQRQKKNGCIPVVCDFISENPERIHYIQKDGENGCTPRSLEKLSNILRDNDISSNSLLEATIYGKIGEEVGAEFFVYYKTYESSLKIDSIIEEVFNNKQHSLSDISDKLKILTSNIEHIRKRDLLYQLLELSKEELESGNYNILGLSLICYLSCLNFEISIAFCKKIKAESPDLYLKIVKLDETINGKKFFQELIKYSRSL